MMRIFLIIEDTIQMNSLTVLLNKLGCILESQGTELGLKDRLLSFRPDVIITAGTGKKVNPANVMQKIRESQSDSKVILLLGKGMKLSLNDLAEQSYDAFVENPFDPLKLITAINKFKGKSTVDLVEKYQKIMHGSFGAIPGLRAGEMRPAAGNNKESFSAKFSTTLAPEARTEKYRELTFGITVNPTSTFSKAAVREKLAEMQKDLKPDLLKELDVEKRRFVKELFRKK